MEKKVINNIDEYISSFPNEIRDILEKIRATIKKSTPNAEEKISYQMPTFYLNWNLVHFAAFKNHIWFYPTPSWTEAFKNEISRYESWKGSIKFSLNEEIPYDLITKIVEFRLNENLNKKSK